MKQTAVEWLFDNLVKVKDVPFEEQANAILKAFEQAKQMEKEQIMNAWLVDGYTDISNDYWKKEFEEYYNETFKSDGLVQNSL